MNEDVFRITDPVTGYPLEVDAETVQQAKEAVRLGGFVGCVGNIQLASVVMHETAISNPDENRVMIYHFGTHAIFEAGYLAGVRAERQKHRRRRA